MVGDFDSRICPHVPRIVGVSSQDETRLCEFLDILSVESLSFG